MIKIIYFLITICAPVIFSCVFGSANNIGRQHFIDGNLWYNRKSLHDGTQLSKNDLITIASMSNETHLKEILNPIMIPRVVGTNGHERVRNHIVSQMKLLSWTVDEDHFYDTTPFGEKRFTNIISTLDTSAPRRLVLACHYDSKLTPADFIGAIDSAVPCAMLINLALILNAALKRHNNKGTELTLQFIFFDGEEAFVDWSRTDSLYGARKLASKLHNSLFPPDNIIRTNELHRMDMLLLLDLIGTYDTNFFSYFSDTQKWYDRFQLYETQSRNLGLLSQRPSNIFKGRKLYNAGIEDDHIPFLEKDVPILHLISVPFPSVWHKSSDNEASLHYPTIKDMNILTRAFVVDYLSLSL